MDKISYKLFGIGVSAFLFAIYLFFSSGLNSALVSVFIGVSLIWISRMFYSAYEEHDKEIREINEKIEDLKGN